MFHIPRGNRLKGEESMQEKVHYLLARYATSRNVRASVVVFSVLLMALAGGAPDVGAGGT